jgi:hypothetical protein
VGEGRSRSKRWPDLATSSHLAPVGCSHLVALPVHRQRISAQHLDAVHAHIADAAAGVRGDHHREGDIASSIAGPGGKKRNIVEAHPIVALHDFLAGWAPALHPGRKLPHLGQLREHCQLAEQSLGDLQVEHLGDASPDLVEILHSERQAHSPHGPEEVDGDGMRALSTIVEQHILEQECRPASRALHGPVRDLRDLQPGADWVSHAGQLADAVDRLDEVAEVV